MKVVFNKFIPFKGFLAINLFGVLFVRNEYKNSKFTTDMSYQTKVFNHESIHTEQMKDFARFLPSSMQQYVGGVIFYILYFFEWLFKAFIFFMSSTSAYRRISFEKEAYKNESNLDYLKTRKHFAQYRRNK